VAERHRARPAKCASSSAISRSEEAQRRGRSRGGALFRRWECADLRQNATSNRGPSGHPLLEPTSGCWEEDVMRKIATIAAATLALGWGVAKAETVDTTPPDDSTGVGVGVGTDTTTTAPANPATVQPPPATPNADVNINPVTSPSYPDARPSDAPTAAQTGARVE